MKCVVEHVIILLLTSLAVHAATPPADRAMEKSGTAKRPNILFLFGDDWAWPHASCLGTPGIQTPTFDRLVREGVLFRNAHVAAPSCAPSRAAVLTGQWHWRLEAGVNLHGTLLGKFAVYSELLKQAGYFVGSMGKGYGPGFVVEHTGNVAGATFKAFSQFLAARPKDRPFCFWFGSRHPHRSYKAGSGAAAGIDPAKVAVPPHLPDNQMVRNDIADYYLAAQAFDQEAGQLVAALEKTGALDDTLTGMERHARTGRTDGTREGVGYPMRTLITKDFHYIRKFRPQRWPAADPVELVPKFAQIAMNTYATAPDCDAGPSKAWIVTHGRDPQTAPFYERAFGKRPARELYDLRTDPYELKNVAEDPAYAATVKSMGDRLMAELKATGDPRVTGHEDEIELLGASPMKTPKQQANSPKP